MSMRSPFIFIVVTGFVLSGNHHSALADDAAAVEFFESRIRPVLVERCHECHSSEAKKSKGGLRLDSRAALIQGGDTGPAINSDRPSDSLLLRAVRHDDKDLQMPPSAKKKLSPQQVKDFETWLQAGAVYPRSETTGRPAIADAASTHWAFQPLQDSPAPQVKDQAWPRTTIDRFILAKLEAAKLSPAARADARTLIRRATFDLHGLPPTPDELDAFIKDVATPGAYERLIDRLLASPRYGEHWGRHWLDLARYSDTKGYVYGDREERFFVHAHAYRDWVIRAFNDDLPYDRFLLMQIAADQVQPAALEASPALQSQINPASQSDLAAIGFLTLGRRFLGVTHDIIDDRIDTLTRTTLGLTVSCARCHDHKFDPIPTDDYYSLYGVFMNTTERTVPIVATDPDTDAYRAFEKELRSREKKLSDAFAGKRQEWSDRVRAMSADYLLALLATDKLWTEEFYAFVGPNEVNPPFVRQWQSYLHRRNQAGFDAIFEPWHRLAKMPAQEWSASAGERIAQLLRENPTLNKRVAAALTAGNITSMQDLARMYGKLLVDTDKAWRELKKNDASATALPDADDEALWQVLYASDSPVLVPDRSIYEAEFFFDEGTRVHLAKLQAEIDKWLIQAPGATPHAVILDDLPQASRRTARVFRRGNPALPGKEVDRQFLALLSGKDRKPFEHGAGRIDLARAIIDPKNPLTARVMVNRIWQHHFSSGLVATPSDFGTRAAPPTHPQLLDHLALQFIRDGWSIKKMHKAIMTSAGYMQSSSPLSQSETAAVDPSNNLLHHYPRQRLAFESMRDAMLAVTGELSSASGGRPVDLFSQPFTTRRSVYGLVDRQFFPGEMRIFDVASPDLHSPTRPTNTIPQQALFFMNSAFVKQRAQALAKRIEREADTHNTSRINRLYQLLYQRNATDAEMSHGLAFVESLEEEAKQPAAPPAPPKGEAWTYGYGELDEKAGKLTSFTKLPHFTGSAWQGGSNWPDAKLGWVQLTAEGGHAGNDLKHAAIRRWISPRAMSLSIAAMIRHEHEQGDGIRAFIVHTKQSTGEGSVLGTWTLQNQTVDTSFDKVTMDKGDTIDFIVDIRGNLNSDDFIWKPVLSELGETSAFTKTVKRTWTSHTEFEGIVSAPPQPLSAWEMYAQVLMLGNEFMFVD